jgi:hypothetical protein
MEAGIGIEKGLGGISKETGQIRAQVSDTDAESLCQPPNGLRPRAALAALDQTEEGAGNSRFPADLFTGKPVRTDVFGDIHTELLHYVNFTGKGDFT